MLFNDKILSKDYPYVLFKYFKDQEKITFIQCHHNFKTVTEWHVFLIFKARAIAMPLQSYDQNLALGNLPAFTIAGFVSTPLTVLTPPHLCSFGHLALHLPCCPLPSTPLPCCPLLYTNIPSWPVSFLPLLTWLAWSFARQLQAKQWLPEVSCGFGKQCKTISCPCDGLDHQQWEEEGKRQQGWQSVGQQGHRMQCGAAGKQGQQIGRDDGW